LKQRTPLVKSSFQEVQRCFTAHVREPTVKPPPSDVLAPRIAVYASLVFKNLDSLLKSCFPVLHSVLAVNLWEELVRDFLAHHRARSPLFSQIPGEFLGFLATRAVAATEPGFLRELAHYEWLELDVSYDPRELSDCVIYAEANPFNHVPVLNPLARLQAYTYPVHRIGPDYLPGTLPAEPTYLVVFRERADGVAFTQLTPVTARLVQMIQSNVEGCSGETLLHQLGAELQHPDPATLLSFGREILRDLQQRELLLGARFAGEERFNRG
jgi:uncharacterized protein